MEESIESLKSRRDALYVYLTEIENFLIKYFGTIKEDDSKDYEIELLEMQYEAMESYMRILSERIELLNKR